MRMLVLGLLLTTGALAGCDRYHHRFRDDDDERAIGQRCHDRDDCERGHVCARTAGYEWGRCSLPADTGDGGCVGTASVVPGAPGGCPPPSSDGGATPTSDQDAAIP